jgi:hypothetical protein
LSGPIDSTRRTPPVVAVARTPRAPDEDRDQPRDEAETQSEPRDPERSEAEKPAEPESAECDPNKGGNVDFRA